MRKLIFVLVILLVFSGCSSANKIENKTTTTTTNKINIASSCGEYIAEYNNQYYFANPDDNNKLYQMDGKMKNKKLISNKANSSCDLSIQIVDNKLYYIQSSGNINSQKFVGTLYLYDLSKKTETAISNKNICSFTIYNNEIYYSTFDTNKIYVSNLNGLSEKEISSNENSFSGCIQIYNKQLFSCSDEGVYKRDLNGENIVSKCIYPHKIRVYNNKIYYTSDNDGLRELSINNNSFSNEKIVINDDVIDFSFFNNKLYFSTFKNEIYIADLNGENKKIITKGSNPMVLNNHLFYFDENGKMQYISQN